jgi:hypothetical protein
MCAIALYTQAAVRLNCLMLTNPFETYDELSARIQEHYQRQFLGQVRGMVACCARCECDDLAACVQVYKLLGSSAVLGNVVRDASVLCVRAIACRAIACRAIRM